MRTFYFDWKRGQIDGLWEDSDTLVRFGSLTDLLESLDEPTILVCEATVESYNPQVRTRLIAESTAAGHVWRVFAARLTRRHGRNVGFTEADKTDEFDAWLIRDLARTHPEWLKTPRIGDEEGLDHLDHIAAASRELNRLRNTNVDFVITPRSRKRKVVTGKDRWHEHLVTLLPAYDLLTPTQQIAFGDGKSYSKSLIPAVAMATKHARNRADFEQITGLFIGGHPSQIRSDVHHHNMRHKSISRSDFRREVRWLYHRFNEVVDKLGPEE